MAKPILFYLCLLFSMALSAQLSTKDANPISFTVNENLQAPISFDLSKHDIPEFNTNKRQTFHKIGYLIPFSINLTSNTSNLSQLENGYLWRYEFKATNALALNLYFEKFKLPEGAKLYVTDKNKQQILGAFTHTNNSASLSFATELITGENIYLEYYEPYNAEFNGILQLEGLGYVTNDYNINSSEAKDFGDSESCQVNVACSEGNNKSNQINASVRILVRSRNFIGWCSGTVMNNTLNDCSPYLLTALHCAYDDNDNMATTANFSQWIFYFRYQHSTCSGSSIEPNDSYSLTGASVLAHSNDDGGETGSDFLLLGLDYYIPSNYNVYYAGWDMSNSARTSTGYGIHHPSGDVKKISTHTTRPSYDSWGGSVSNTHLEVDWVATSNGYGTSEGGSSGSALFNSNGLVIGTLTGGWASCSSRTESDYYGAMNYHYLSNGTAFNRNLKYWLADNTNTTVLQGSSTCDIANSVENVVENSFINIYPNPSNGIINIQVENSLNTQIEVIDILGRGILLLSKEGEHNIVQIDLCNQSNGIYFVKVKTDKAQKVSKIIISK